MSRVLLFFCLLTGSVQAQVAIADLDLPLFDAAGHLVRRLKAASGTGSLKVSVLKSGTVEFFGTDKAEAEKIGVLNFDDATYQASADIIESAGPMQLHFANGDLAAVGFRYEIQKGRLLLKSAVVMHTPEAHVTGREGEVLLSQNKSDRDMLVSVATIRGDVTITEIKVNGVAVDRVETSSATYTGHDETLRPAAPVTTWSKGTRGEMSGQISWVIGRRSPPTPVSPPPETLPIPLETRPVAPVQPSR